MLLVFYKTCTIMFLIQTVFLAVSFIGYILDKEYEENGDDDNE